MTRTAAPLPRAGSRTVARGPVRTRRTLRALLGRDGLGLPWLGVLLLVFALPANGVASAFLPGASATAFGAIKDATILGLFLLVLVSGRIKRVPVPIVVLVLMIVGLGAVSAVWTENPIQAAYGWRNDFLPFLALIVVPALLQKRHLGILATAFVVALQLSSITTILTWNQGLDWLFTLGVFPLAPGTPFPSSLFVAGSIVPRGFSPYSAPNESAVAVTIALAVLWTRPRWPLWLKGALTLLPLVAVYLTQSRSGYIGLAMLAVTLVAWALFRAKPMLVWAMLTVTTAAAVGGVTLYLYIDKVISHVADPSLIGHSDSLLENIPLLVAHPFGFGLGKVGPRAQLYSTDSVLVESFFLVLAIESGIIVMLLFAALLVYLFLRGLRAPTLDGFLPTAVVAGTLVSYTVLPTLQEGPVAYTLWIVCGMGVVAGRAEQAVRAGTARVREPSPSRNAAHLDGPRAGTGAHVVTPRGEGRRHRLQRSRVSGGRRRRGGDDRAAGSLRDHGPEDVAPDVP